MLHLLPEWYPTAASSDLAALHIKHLTTRVANAEGGYLVNVSMQTHSPCDCTSPEKLVISNI